MTYTDKDVSGEGGRGETEAVGHARARYRRCFELRISGVGSEAVEGAMNEKDECVTCGVTIGGEHDCATATPYAAARSARIRELEAALSGLRSNLPLCQDHSCPTCRAATDAADAALSTKEPSDG